MKQRTAKFDAAHEAPPDSPARYTPADPGRRSIGFHPGRLCGNVARWRQPDLGFQQGGSRTNTDAGKNLHQWAVALATCTDFE
jgi:hypothetical protein